MHLQAARGMPSQTDKDMFNIAYRNALVTLPLADFVFFYYKHTLSYACMLVIILCYSNY